MLAVYAALMALPFIALMRGDLKEYHPLVLAAPTMSMFYCVNVCTKLAVGALSGFEYVAILTGETRSPVTRYRAFGAYRLTGDRPRVHSRHKFGARFHR